MKHYPRSWVAALLVIGSGCEEPASKPEVKSTAAAPSASAAPSAAASMTVKQFCDELGAKMAALAKSCAAEPKSERQLLDLSLEGHDDRCARVEKAKVVADKVPACLAEMKTHWDADLVHMMKKPVCRAAFAGQAKIGEACNLDLECPAGSYCAARMGVEDPLDNACTPVIEEGTPCRVQVGATCGDDFVCKDGKCTAARKAGEPCDTSQAGACAHGLTCLRERSSDAAGKCGTRRKAGEDCHRWTECHGACITPSEAVKDGKCASFCGSP